jgi:predicted RecA/RadA family phage recombinase
MRDSKIRGLGTKGLIFIGLIFFVGLLIVATQSPAMALGGAMIPIAFGLVSATPVDGVSNLRTLRYTHNADTVAGNVVVYNGLVLIAVNDALANVENVWIYAGRVTFPKEADLAVNQGDQIYWDSGNSVITTTAGANTPCGFCQEKAAASDTTITVMLWPDIIAATVTNIQLADGKVLIGAANGIAAAKTLSGDFTITREGVATLKATKSLENTIADPGTGQAIPVDKSGSIAITTAAAETNTLAAPDADGLLLSLTCNVYAVGDRVITCATTVNQTGNNTLTFGAAGDTILLYSVMIGGALRWRVAANDGVALSTV